MKRTNWFWFSALIIAGVFYLLNSLSTIFFPFFLGLIGAYAFDGIVTRMGRFKISRGLASAIVILGVILLLIVMLIIFIPFLQQQFYVLGSNVPSMVESSFATIKPLLERSASEFGTPSPAELQGQIKSHLGDILTWSIKLITNVLTNGMALANVLSLIFLTPIIMFYLLKDWPKLVCTVEALIPAAYSDQVKHLAKRIDYTLSAYAVGQSFVCLVLMVLYSVSLTLIGLPQGFFVGILTGFMSFIPYVGMLAGLLASLAVSIANLSGLNQVTSILIVFGLISIIESNFLAPRLIGEKVGLHPVWIIFSLLAGATWFGFVGILIALPTAAMIGVIVRIALEFYRSSGIYLGTSREVTPAA